MPSKLRSWRPQLPSTLWILLGVALGAFVAARLGVFSPSQLVETASGPRWLPTAFAGVDHPFHIARAETLRQALLDGELLRWISNHQGGYPVEFYPLGVAWLEVAAWALTLGVLSIPQVHTLVIVFIFLAPGLAFAVLAHQDGWSPRVAVIALALHVVVPGDWWHGGYTELVQWGLVTNVAGAVAALFCLAWLIRYVESGNGMAAAGTALSVAAAVYANPRSLIALVVVGSVVWLATVMRSGAGRQGVVMTTARIGVVGVLAALLAAPELLSLARFSGLYMFVRYEWYLNLGDYLQSALTAISTPVFVLAVAGLVLSLVTRAHLAARAVAVTLLLYSLVTVLLIGQLGDALSQLEPTRLMPFQRLLTVYLAAVAIELFVRWVAGFLGRRTILLPDVVLALMVVGLVLVRADSAAATMPVPAQTDPLAPALYPVERAAAPQQADFEDAIRLADADAAPGTAVLVIGSSLSWHQRLWAPLWTDRPMYYDNWLWYWHDAHAGPAGYVWSQGHHYPEPGLALDPDFLAHHGIGAVVITGPLARAAASDPWLEQRRSGTSSVFLVRDPMTLVDFAGTNAERIEMSPSALIATGASGGGTATIRRNWYPRWQAIVNGEPAPVTRTDDGYMSVPVPSGPVTLELRYGVDAMDWLGRALAALGVCGIVVVALRQRERERPPSAPSASPELS